MTRVRKSLSSWTTQLTLTGDLFGEFQESEVNEALKKMKTRKTLGPDDIPIEVWRYLGDIAIVWLTKLFNIICLHRLVIRTSLFHGGSGYSISPGVR
jgi:hypothetical protein